MFTTNLLRTALGLLFAGSLGLAGCGGDSTPAANTDVDSSITTTAAEASTTEPVTDTSTEVAGDDEAAEPLVGASSFQIEVWADNWMAVYVDGELIGEDSVPITTERSFNSETFTFEAASTFTVAIEAKDFKETDSGIEYIGEGNQQMGDGGIIAQITDLSSGEVVAVTDASWTTLVAHRAPLNKECERSADPDTECEFEILEVPSGWADPDFDDSGWISATEWSAGDVRPKDGYDQIDWNSAAQLVWGTDLEVDNTVLLRTTVET